MSNFNRNYFIRVMLRRLGEQDCYSEIEVDEMMHPELEALSRDHDLAFGPVFEQHPEIQRIRQHTQDRTAERERLIKVVAQQLASRLARFVFEDKIKKAITRVVEHRDPKHGYSPRDFECPDCHGSGWRKLEEEQQGIPCSNCLGTGYTNKHLDKERIKEAHDDIDEKEDKMRRDMAKRMKDYKERRGEP